MTSLFLPFRLLSFLLATTIGIGCATAGPIPTFELLWAGKATHFYGVPTNAEQQRIHNKLQSQQIAERMAAVASGFRLRSNIAVGIEPCGIANAYFSQDRQAIVICTEFLELIGEAGFADSALTAQYDERHLNGWLKGVMWGVYFHELAHALIHINQIGITGREEDVADQFAVWYALRYVDLTKQPIITPMAWFWNALAKRRNLSSIPENSLRTVLADEHSLDEQRVFNVACWALGANPEMGSRTAAFVNLPESRASRCAQEYEQMHRGMNALFTKYIKTKPGN